MPVIKARPCILTVTSIPPPCMCETLRSAMCAARALSNAPDPVPIYLASPSAPSLGPSRSGPLAVAGSVAVGPVAGPLPAQ